MLHLGDVAAVDLPAADRINLGSVVIAREVPSPISGGGGWDGEEQVERMALAKLTEMLQISTTLNVINLPHS